MKTAKVKKALLMGVSLVLVAVMAVAGTVAYLQDTSDDVVNTFSTNKVNVALTESGDGQYNIIPGTSEAKDPKVKVDNSLDSYVFVKVVDTSDGVVTYDIADGWTALDGYPGVYYREVTKDADSKDFYVLKDNQVSYDAALTNDDMPEAPVTLTFTAYAIQKEGFATAKDAWENVPVVVALAEDATAEDFVEAVEASAVNEVVQLNNDLAITSELPQSATGVTNIDLNGNKLTANATDRTYVTDGHSLIIENGQLAYSNSEDVVFDVKTGSSVTLENVEMTTDATVLFPQGDAAEVNVINSTITTTDAYCIATNAGKADNYNVVINLENSVLNVENQYGPTVLINVPGTLNIDNCVISGERIAVAVRGGTATITNSTLTSLCNADGGTSSDEYFISGNWGTGNRLPQASLVLGNRSTSYQYPTVCTLEGVTLSTYEYGRTLYVYGNATEALGVTLTYDGTSDVGTVVYGGGYAVINGVVQEASTD